MANINTYQVPLKFMVGIPLFSCIYLFCLTQDTLDPVAMTGIKVLPIGIIFILMEKLNVERSHFSNYMQIGLIFSSFGDISLELEPTVEGDILFLCGLGNFLIAHWFYVYAMSIDIVSPKYLGFLISYGFAGSFFYIMNSYSLKDELKIAVAAYAFTIATMLWTSIRRLGSKNSTRRSQVLGIVGAAPIRSSDLTNLQCLFHMQNIG
mmetsp:Transcript_53779/g.69071  ORF Transcript_53779/g.69071 Transcript_53779/m.69071 type:complete len:207 (-) Transcript_53779:221-841(-)